MDPVRITAVRYLNTAPLIEGLDQLQGLTLVPAAPAQIADQVVRGETDIGLCSVVDAAREELELLPVGMIGCDGPTLTVRVFSSVPIDRITTLHADRESHTSVILAQLLLRKLHGLAPRIEAFAAERTLHDAWPESLLLIGDKVVVDHPPSDRYPHQLDLGEAWKQLIGLPFVYAVWMCRAGRSSEPRIRTAAAILARQRLHNASRIDWLVNKRAAGSHWPLDVARDYLGRLLRYDIGAREREAVGRFIAEAAELGLLPNSSVRWSS
jgi:chorismate dehydratase